MPEDESLLFFHCALTSAWASSTECAVFFSCQKGSKTHTIFPWMVGVVVNWQDTRP